MRPMAHGPWGGDPHLQLRDERHTFAADPSFSWGWQRWREIRGELAHAEHDGLERWPTETHRRLHRCLRMWVRQQNPLKLLLSLVASQPDRLPWRQLIEDLYLAVSKDEGLENFNHSLIGEDR
jgi:hypothetical protein